jgi:hypothetical protein
MYFKQAKSKQKRLAQITSFDKSVATKKLMIMGSESCARQDNNPDSMGRTRGNASGTARGALRPSARCARSSALRKRAHTFGDLPLHALLQIQCLSDREDLSEGGSAS